VTRWLEPRRAEIGSSPSAQLNAPAAEESGRRGLRKALGLWDLVPMQVLLVIGVTWPGIAARQGGTHVAFWLLAVVLLFIPVAAVITYCVQIWPLEGGVYQWTKHGIGPFAGFISAWNYGCWALLLLSNLGITTASSMAYALGPSAAWMADSHALIATLNIVLFGLILLVNIPGFQVGRWIAHFGTAVTVLVIVLLAALIFIHPHATRLHPHHSPQAPFSAAFPTLTLLSVNLFSKLAFNGLTGLEQVAVFAGETRHAARAILRSAWIAAPAIALMYILMSGALLVYTPANQIDLTAPMAQAFAAAFGGGIATGQVDWGSLLGKIAIVVVAITVIASYVVVVAGASRLPMVAAWDHLFPSWFTRLHPKFRTPTRSIIVIVVLALLCALLASVGTGAQEAWQLLTVAANCCYAVYYLLMFAVPLVVGTRFSPRPDLKPGFALRCACVSGMGVTLLSLVLGVVPIIEVAHPVTFAVKVVLSGLAFNLVGASIYVRGTRKRAISAT
jgi:amino acid transporter